jgi:hypothetical protein
LGLLHFPQASPDFAFDLVLSLTDEQAQQVDRGLHTVAVPLAFLLVLLDHPPHCNFVRSMGATAAALPASLNLFVVGLVLALRRSYLTTHHCMQ